MDIPPRLLEQFGVLAEERHFGHAAERLSMSQPSLSQAIQRLERILGVRLLDRTTRSVQLTPAGEAFARDARALLGAQHAAVGRAQRIASGTEGEVRLGYNAVLGYEFLPRLLRSCRERYPNLRLHLFEHSSAVSASLVRSGGLDLAFVRAPLVDTDGLTLRDVGTDRIAAALPANHHLATQPALRLADLSNEGFALLSEPMHSGVVDLVTTACRAAGFIPRIVARADTVPGVVIHVASGSSVSLVPDQMRSGGFPGVAIRPLSDRDQPSRTAPHLQTLAATRVGYKEPSLDRIIQLAVQISRSMTVVDS